MQMPSHSADELPILVTHLTQFYGRATALSDLSLQVPRGAVFGLVGENGAGKTTLIKLMLGLLVPNAGSVTMFGMDPIQHPERVLGRLGYLSEDHDLPHWMRVNELIRYNRSFYPNWDDAYAEELRQQFGLDEKAKVKNLSRGQCALAGLLIALAHKPELLVLDEPSSGLDAIARRDILAAIVRTVADEGRTVFFSSHLLDEVERVADTVAMLNKGKLVLCAGMDEIKAQHHTLTLHFPEPVTGPLKIAGALSIEGRGKEWTVVCNGEMAAVRASAESLGASIVEESTPSLEDIFIARAGRRSLKV
ncbi:MAG TPA: ABC transporter ATP-binding protein [Candidatus Hydrogenedentes bacterium]|nr:ABC transporter ATP-binding protein [Candidatus Hydrogenedentota bacterium]